MIDKKALYCHREPLAVSQRRGDLLDDIGDCFARPDEFRRDKLAVTPTCFFVKALHLVGATVESL